jgi:hypothetical protein
MNNIITIDNIKPFTDQCFDGENDKANQIVKEIMYAKSPSRMNLLKWIEK